MSPRRLYLPFHDSLRLAFAIKELGGRGVAAYCDVLATSPHGCYP